MKKLLLALVASFLPVFAGATDLIITVVPPTTYLDGTPFPTSEVLTCTLYGANEGQPLVKLATGDCTIFTRTNVDKGVSKCYALTATSTLFGLESLQSAPFCHTIAIPPQATNPPSGNISESN